MDFQREVIEQSRATPVLVDFWAPWCGPCRVLGPVLERLEQGAGGRWRLVKINTDEEQEIAARWQIRGIPAVKLFVDGALAAEFTGALPQPAVERWLAEHLPTPAGRSVATAKALVQRHERAGAIAALEAGLAQEPGHREARVLLAELVLLQDPVRAVTLVADFAEDPDFQRRADAVRTLARLLGEGWQAELSPAPSPARDTYVAAAQALARGEFSAAAQGFIETLRRDRKLDDDGAKRASVALFTWLGDEHPVTQEYRRAFASALY